MTASEFKERPLKIAMINTMYAPHLYGGAERVVRLLSEGLVAKGHEVVVITAGPGRRPSRREVDGVQVHEVGLVNMYWPYGPKGAPRLLEPAWHVLDLWNPWMVSRAGRVVRRERPHVVHTHGLVGFSTRLWPEISQIGLSIVHTLHDYRLECVHAGMYKRGRACIKRCVNCRIASTVKRGPASAVDVVVGISRHVLDSHLESGFFSHARKEVIPVPVDVPPSLPVPARNDEVLRLGYLGRIHPGKGVENLVAATLGLPATGWDLAIAGSGEDRFVRQVKGMTRHGNVRFVGPVEASTFLAGLDALVVPSRWQEAAGLVAAEAFACGVPVLASRRGGLCELVGDGQTGFLFDPDDHRELPALLGRCIADPSVLRAFRSACRERSKAHDVDAVVDSYVRCYESVLDEGRRA